MMYFTRPIWTRSPWDHINMFVYILQTKYELLELEPEEDHCHIKHIF